MNLIALALIILAAFPAFASVNFNSDLVRPWNKEDKREFPSPMAAVFKKFGKMLIFVGDRHVDQIATARYLEGAFKRYSPEIVVVEGEDFSDGENPMTWGRKYISMTKDELLKETSAVPAATQLAHTHGVKFRGGEPSIEEEMNSPYLLSKGYSKDDIRNVRILQRIPYRRDKMKIAEPDRFFDFAMKLYKVQEDLEPFKTKFKKWYKDKAKRDFDYNSVSKEETDINCSVKDTFLQSASCAINVNRDRSLVEILGKLFKTYSRIMVVYGTGHFVQEYPAFVHGFDQKPEFYLPSEK